MRRYTDTYHKARLAGARPIFLLFLGTDKGFRCFGKHTPTPAQIGTEYTVLEWSARVLAFGDFRQSLSTDSDEYLQGLFEEEVSAYGCELDNADGYFSRIAGKETFLNGDVILLQAFDYPGIVFDDFQSLFFGRIETFEFDKLKFKFNAIQALKPEAPADPTVDTTKIYALSNAGSGFTGASGTFSYATMQPSFYTSDDWTYTAEIDKDTLGVTETLFRIENNAFDEDRIQIGINTSNQVFVRYTDDVNSATPTYTTITADWALTSSATRLTIEWDTVDEVARFYDNFGNSYIFNLTSTSEFQYDSQFGSSGTGNGQFNFPFDCAIDSGGNIYVVDYSNDRVQKFDSSGTYLLQFGGFGTGNGQFDEPLACAVDAFDNVYVTDSGNDRVQKFNSNGVYQSQFGTTGTGNGQFQNPFGISVSQNTNIIVSDATLDRVQIFNSSGTYISQFGTFGTGNGQFDTPTMIETDGINSIFVVDRNNDRIQIFSSTGTYASQFGSSGSGDGQFTLPEGITILGSEIIISDSSLNRIQRFSAAGSFLEKFGTTGTGNGQFQSPGGMAAGSTFIWVTDGSNDRLQKIDNASVIPNFDMDDTGSSDDFFLMEDFDGTSSNMGWNDTYQAISYNNTNTDWPDNVNALDVPLDDGTWVDSGIEIEEVTTEPDTEQPLDPISDIILPDSGRYSSPGENNQNVILPMPYGNCRENSDGGVWVAPLIDSSAYVYCVAGWPIQSVANGNTVQVYVDGVLTPSGWTFDESNDYESQGNIAILDFTSDPGGVVTVKCNGKWVDGALLTNPVDIIEDFLDYAAGLVGNQAWEKDPTTFAKARNDADVAGYVAAGIIQSNQTIGFWIKNILKSFLGGFRFNSDGLLEIKLTPLSESQSVHEELMEYEAISINAKQILNNICGRIVVNYAISYAETDRRFKNNATTSYFRTADKSQTAINPQSWTLDFDWCRNSANIETMQDILLALYADPEYLVNYQGQDFKFVPLNLTDQIQSTISFLLDSGGNAVQNVIYSIREKTINLDDFTTTLNLQSVNFVDVAVVTDTNVTLGEVLVTLGTQQVTLGA